MLELICHTVQDGCQISVSGDAGIDPLCERLKKKKKKEKKSPCIKTLRHTGITGKGATIVLEGGPGRLQLCS